MHIYLKVKINSLTAEARDIRNQERKMNCNSRARKRMARAIQLKTVITHWDYLDRESVVTREPMNEAQIVRLERKLQRSRNRLQGRAATIRNGLMNHRRNDVRKESRSSFIAYAFLRGKRYEATEITVKPVDWDKVEYLVMKYGEKDERTLKQEFAAWKDHAIEIRLQHVQEANS